MKCLEVSGFLRFIQTAYENRGVVYIVGLSSFCICLPAFPFGLRTTLRAGLIRIPARIGAPHWGRYSEAAGQTGDATHHTPSDTVHLLPEHSFARGPATWFVSWLSMNTLDGK